jgi:hypothetical protein
MVFSLELVRNPLFSKGVAFRYNFGNKFKKLFF